MEYHQRPGWADLPPFVRGYIAAAFFCGVEPDRESNDLGISDLAEEAMAEIVGGCLDFQRRNTAALAAVIRAEWGGSESFGPYSEEHAGQDYYFTRNRHGVGYWDRGFPEGVAAEAAENLTIAAETAGESWLWRDGGGRVFVEPVGRHVAAGRRFLATFETA